MGSRWDPAHALERIENAHRDLPPPTVADASTLAWRAEHFASAMRFALDRPDAVRELHRLTEQLCDVSSVGALLPRVLDAALGLTGADFGDVQLVDPSTGALLLITEYGFDSEFSEYFAVVEDESSVCGSAAKAGQTTVFDVAEEPGFAPHRDIAASAGFRGVQSTPLLDYSGRVIGMVSTHFRDPHQPADEQLRLLRLYADFAGEAIARSIGATSDIGFDPIGRALVAALLSPGRAGPFAIDPEARQRLSFDPGRDLLGVESAFAIASDRLVRHLFDIGLQLHTLRAVFDQAAAAPENIRAAGEAVGGVLEDLDMLTRDAGLAMLALARTRSGPPAAERRAPRRRQRR
ncbi:GAF domain-containing protein [Nocardia pseudobrasiliensis]|uniref:GAF domain-containing protein n=1 Tax=Nocardia pseudobrasiliensis TaxID=45979 RepID=A0A370IDT1_9NOCA|nr:GAF domain-containing protein [Nocardia pseudobrasiliensis]RDI67594.1 GAF domain-containing protein [Nocardia pseudobrasiliensis]